VVSHGTKEKADGIEYSPRESNPTRRARGTTTQSSHLLIRLLISQESNRENVEGRKQSHEVLFVVFSR
jgi:hypothetical protein